MPRIPVLSLFCGPGGLDLGFERTGFRPVLVLDVDPVAVETYNRDRAIQRPITICNDLSLTPPDNLIRCWEDHALKQGPPRGIIGGPPCQSFSGGNVHKLQEDPRSSLPLSYGRILRVFRDRFDIDFFVFENVAGLGHQPHQSSLDMFFGEFESAGLDVNLFYLDAVDFGVPQYRKRMFMVGFNNEKYHSTEFSPPVGYGRPITVRQAIEGLPSPVYFSRGTTPRKQVCIRIIGA